MLEVELTFRLSVYFSMLQGLRSHWTKHVSTVDVFFKKFRHSNSALKDKEEEIYSLHMQTDVDMCPCLKHFVKISAFPCLKF